MTAAESTHTPTELAHRSGGGIAVSLFWSRADGAVTLSVENLASGRISVLHVEPERALEAFYHPFAYAERPAARRVRVVA